jgi:hypothetical protein
VLSPNVRWTLQRIALLDSPLVMIAAIASIATDRPLLGAALALISFALFLAGRATIGLRHGPAETTTPLERSSQRRARPRVGATPPEDTGASTQRRRPPRRRRDFKGF